MRAKVSFIVLMFVLFQTAIGQNLRQISSREGISNNAVLSMCQDKDGYIWLGTCDGLNLWDGNEMQLFPPSPNTVNYLSGNMIEKIVETQDGQFWVRTNHGMDKVDPKTNSVEHHNGYEGTYRFATKKAMKCSCFFRRKVLVIIIVKLFSLKKLNCKG